jgi:hypothetical protein
VLVLGVGVLLDFLINLAKVLGGDGGVVTKWITNMTSMAT